MFAANLSWLRHALRALGASTIFLASAGSNAALITVGDAAIDRTFNDSFSNFVITLPGEAFASNGTFDSWNVYVGSGGSMGLLILSGATSAPTVVHSLLQTNLTVGLNSFTLASALAVSAGDYLGIWMGNSKVDFDFTATGVAYSGNGAYSSMPTVGTVLTTNGNTSRDYSINVGFTAVPEPGTLALLGLSLTGLAVSRRLKQAGR